MLLTLIGLTQKIKLLHKHGIKPLTLNENGYFKNIKNSNSCSDCSIHFSLPQRFDQPILLPFLKCNLLLFLFLFQKQKRNNDLYIAMYHKQFSWTTVQSFVCTQFKYQSSIWPIDRTLSGATTPGQSGSESNGSEGVLRILQSSSITGTTPSDCLILYPGHSLSGSYPSAEMQSVYSTVPAN